MGAQLLSMRSNFRNEIILIPYFGRNIANIDNNRQEYIKHINNGRKSQIRNVSIFPCVLHQLNGDPSFGYCVEQLRNHHMLDQKLQKKILFHRVGSEKHHWTSTGCGLMWAAWIGMQMRLKYTSLSNHHTSVQHLGILKLSGGLEIECAYVFEI